MSSPTQANPSRPPGPSGKAAPPAAAPRALPPPSLPPSAARAGAPPAVSTKFDLATVRTEVAADLPDRIVVHGVEGWGKTSLAAQAPGVLFLMARGETGLETLIRHGQLGAVPHAPEVQSWQELISAVDALIEQEHPYRTLVLDTANGFERLMHEYVVRSQFGGDWGEQGFLSYGKGPEVALVEWNALLARLDRLREQRKVQVILLAHTRVKTFKNPDGPDYDRFAVDLHDKTWGITHKWADLILFGNFLTEAVKEKGQARAKGKGGVERVMFTTREAAYDAKHRHGLPPEIEVGRSPAEAWNNLQQAIAAGEASAREGRGA